jgi:hypothetical protein
MATRAYLTVPEELLVEADAVGDYLEEYGYTVTVEERELGFPYAPTFLCKRNGTLLVVEVDNKLAFDRLGEWSKYGHSCGTDTRVAVATPDGVARVPADDARLSNLHVGLLLVTEHGVVEVFPPMDMSVNLQLPELRRFSNPVRAALGPVYEMIRRGQWREGFEEGCKTIESLAREYLKRHVVSGRIKVLDSKGRVRTPSVKDIERYTLGSLALRFGRIQNKSHRDIVVGEVLQKINGDRITVVHKKATGEVKLRQNVGQNMWTLVRGISELLDDT